MHYYIPTNGNGDVAHTTIIITLHCCTHTIIFTLEFLDTQQLSHCWTHHSCYGDVAHRTIITLSYIVVDKILNRNAKPHNYNNK